MEINVRGLQHLFRGKPAREALAEINCQISPGQFVAIVGPSGCGKSTFLRLIANLLEPSGGEILLDGKSPAEIAAQRRIAWMSQSPALLPWLTVGENVTLAKRFSPKANVHRLSVEEALSRVGLEDDLDAYPAMLSGGMQQRLALARILTMDADLWLMDEPFSALDELTRERLTIELLELWRPLQPTVLWVTHNIYEAIRLADRILVMSPSPGRLTADIPVDLPYPRSEPSSAFQGLLCDLREVLGQGSSELVLNAYE